MKVNCHAPSGQKAEILGWIFNIIVLVQVLIHS